MRYQLVVQFETRDSTRDFEELVELEARLGSRLGKIAQIDGHDFGSSEFNIFIFTDNPNLAFETARRVVLDERVPHPMRAAYRELTGDEFVILWPPTLREFKIS